MPALGSRVIAFDILSSVQGLPETVLGEAGEATRGEPKDILWTRGQAPGRIVARVTPECVVCARGPCV